MSIVKLSCKDFDFISFPKAEITEVTYHLNKISFQGDFLWMGMDSSKPLMEGVGRLTFNLEYAGDAFSAALLNSIIQRDTTPKVFHSNYQLSELKVDEWNKKEEQLEKNGQIIFEAFSTFYRRIYRYTDESINYAIRHFNNKPYWKGNPFPCDGGIYLDNRWVYFPSECFGYLAPIARIKACFIAHRHHCNSFILVLETMKQELVVFQVIFDEMFFESL